MDPQTVTVGDTQIRILPTVKGLVSEAKIVEDEINSFEPKLVTLSIGPEEIDGTRKWDGQPYDMSGWDEIYGLSLRKLVGDDGVRLPPPSFTKAIKLSDSKNIEVIGIDMDEESFTESYTSNVSTWQLYKRGRLEKKMVKNGIDGNTPEEMVINMENSICEIQGFAKLENDRVQTMCDNLKSNLDRSKILAIIEVSNVDSLIKLLKVEMSLPPSTTTFDIISDKKPQESHSEEKEKVIESEEVPEIEESSMEKLEKLIGMRNAGELTSEDFEEAKKEILKRKPQ